MQYGLIVMNLLVNKFFLRQNSLSFSYISLQLKPGYLIDSNKWFLETNGSGKSIFWQQRPASNFAVEEQMQMKVLWQVDPILWEVVTIF